MSDTKGRRRYRLVSPLDHLRSLSFEVRRLDLDMLLVVRPGRSIIDVMSKTDAVRLAKATGWQGYWR